jgi:hypothetical protein
MWHVAWTAVLAIKAATAAIPDQMRQQQGTGTQID